jgi:type IV pilus assembly protein PilE
MNSFKHPAGFTLIELMITVAIIAILAAIAYPSYTDYVTRAKRADGKAALLQVQLSQEKYRANHITYGTTLSQLGFLPPPTTLCISTVPVSPDCHYTIAISGTPDSTTYTITATPRDFTDAKCGTLGIDQAGTKSITGTDSVQNCWGK